MGYPPEAIETRSYWKVGNGDPFTGGAYGYDSEWTLDGTVIGSCSTKPAGADASTDAEWDILDIAYQATWTTEATGGQAWLDAQMATEAAEVQGAADGLKADTTLTDAQILRITGKTPA